MKNLSLEELKNTCVHIEDGAFPYFVNSLPKAFIGDVVENTVMLAKSRGFKFIALVSNGEGNLVLKAIGAKEYRVLTIADFEESLPFANTKWDVRKWTREQKENWQRLMFESSYSWAGEKGVQKLSADFYILNGDGRMTYDCKDNADYFFRELSFMKQMHYSDAFPEIKKYKYVPIEKSIFDLKERLESGELFTKIIPEGLWIPVEKERHLINLIAKGSPVYERIEYKWNESDEVKDLIKDLCERVMTCQSSGDIEWLVEFREGDFLEFCEKIVKLAKGE